MKSEPIVAFPTPRTHRRGRWWPAVVATAALFLFGTGACGDGRKAGNTPDGSTQVRVTDGSVKITPSFDECADLLVSASPATTHVGETVSVAGAAFGRDAGGGALTYHWTAAAGRFADASAAATTFTCPDASAAGPAVLALLVSDGSACQVKRSVTVDCLARGAAVDAAGLDGSSGMDGAAGGDGAQPDADADTNGAGGAAGNSGAGGAAGAGGAGGGCTGDPSLCEGTLCNQCTFGVQAGETDLCDSDPSGCYNCVPDTDGCAHLTADRDRVSCWALYACIRDSGCAKGSGDIRTCWCGSTPFLDCSTGGQPAMGACLKQFQDAAGTADPAQINQHIIDPGLALGSAVNLAQCRMSFCGTAASADHPACPLW